MSPPFETIPRATTTDWTCSVAAWGMIQAEARDIASLRQNPAPAGRPSVLPAALLKHADEQTVVGLAVLLRAAERLPDADFSAWGVAAAPRFVGRSMFVTALQRFREEGAWGVSPHLIPHRSLHSISGTISQALGIHGPNVGAGNGPDSACEGLLTAVTMLAGGRVPGVWFVATGWSPEQGAECAPTAVCRAFALALVPFDAAGYRPTLRVDIDVEESHGAAFDVDEFSKAWTGGENAVHSYSLAGHGRVTFEGLSQCTSPATSLSDP